MRVEDPDAGHAGQPLGPRPSGGGLQQERDLRRGRGHRHRFFPTRPNVRDTDDLTLTAEVRQDEDYNYWVGATFTADVTVTDDDTAPEFSLSVSPAAIDEGEDVTFTLTRHGDVSQALEEVPFVLRIGADYRRRVWPSGKNPRTTGQPWTRARAPGTTTSLSISMATATVTFASRLNSSLRMGSPRRTWLSTSLFGASARSERLCAMSIGSKSGSRRSTTILFPKTAMSRWISNHNNSEGQELPFVIGRSGSADQVAEELTVQVRYLERGHPYRRGSHLRPDTYFNPSDQRFFMTFPAGETRVSGSFVISVDDVDEGGMDSNTFVLYFPQVPYLGYWSRQNYTNEGHGGPFRDNPRAISIALAEDDSDTIEEGETAEFVLTRGGSTDQSLTLDVAIDDPGDFRRGNHWMHTPDRTVAVTFDAGSSTSTLSVPTSDDWRDIPDNTITATIPPSQDGSYRPAYETEGETSASVTVEDNDVAPKITLTASATTVVEGTAASFTMTRNDTGNRLHIPYEFGVQGEEQFQTYLWGETKSQITLDVDTEDDDYDGPDEIVYAFSMVPLFHVPQDELNQYWTIEGPSSATITVTDNDLPLVGVDEVEQSYRENGHGHVRFVREGQTGDELELNFIITQDGNSLYLTEQIGHELTIYIPAGEESSLTTHLLAWQRWGRGRYHPDRNGGGPPGPVSHRPGTRLGDFHRHRQGPAAGPFHSRRHRLRGRWNHRLPGLNRLHRVSAVPPGNWGDPLHPERFSGARRGLHRHV